MTGFCVERFYDAYFLRIRLFISISIQKFVRKLCQQTSHRKCLKWCFWRF